MQTNSTMTEKELLNDLLNQEKQLASSYTMGITECSCPNMRQVLSQHQNAVCQDQFQIFSQMSQRGYYPTKNADDQDVNTAKQTYSQQQTMMQ